MKNHQKISQYVLASLLCASGYVHAQDINLPGSGSSTTSQQSTSKLDAPPKPSIDVKEKQEKTENQVILGSSGIAYPITSIEFKGNESIESQVLQNALKSSELGAQQKLTFKQIIALSDVITSYYRQHGYMVAKAVIPEQDITAGTLTIQILEGRLDSVQVNSPSPEVKERVQEIINAQLPNGSTIERDQVFRAINVASESTGQTIKVDLEAAEKLGGTRVEVNTQELPSYYGSISADNFGTASTGKYNFIGTLGFNSLLTMGDKLIVQLGTTDQTNLSYRYDFNYLVPVGNDGWSVGARLWKSTYQVGSDFSALNPYGYSQAAGLSAAYALTRSENSRIDWRFGYNQVNLSENYLDGAVTNPRKADVLWTDIGGNYLDNYLGTQANTNWLLNVTSGYLTIDPSSYNYQNQTTAGTYSLFSYQFSREQMVDSGLSVFGNLRGQFADKNLDSYHKFNIGGPLAVRAYPMGEITGDDAVLGTIELRYTQAFNFDGKSSYFRLAGFYDSAWARINHDPLDNQTTDNSAVLSGYGLELDVGIGKNILGRLYAAKSTSMNYGNSHIDNATSRVGIQMTIGF